MTSLGRTLVLAGAAFLALASVGHAAAQSGTPLSLPMKEPPGKKHQPRVDSGIVQSVSRSVIVLKELDGSTLTIRVDAKTRVLLDGKRASLLDVRPGFVAVVKHERNRAQEIRAFDVLTAEDSSRSTPGKDHGRRK
jgi:glucose/arabinose dehydrogenase